MPSDTPFPVPDGAILAWAIANADELKQLVQFINRVKSIQVSVTLPGSARPYSLIDSADNAILALPLKFTTTISAPSGGATIDSQARTAITSLLTALTAVGMN